jgi:hypothetical protein
MASLQQKVWKEETKGDHPMMTMSDYTKARKITPIEVFFEAFYCAHGDIPMPQTIWGQIDLYYRYGTLPQYVRDYLGHSALRSH